MIVADRGLLSLDNMQAIQALQLPDGSALEFILAVPGRRYGEFHVILQDFHKTITDEENETVCETRWRGVRLVVAHHPLRAAEQNAWRRDKIAELESNA